MHKELGFETLALYAGYDPRENGLTTSVPIYQSNAYDMLSADHAKGLFNLTEPGHIYTRLSNPTNDVFEKRMAALEGGVAAVAFSTGHSAIFSTILNLAESGDNIVSSINIYGGAVNLLGVTLRKLGIDVRFVEADDFDGWQKNVDSRTKALFVEGIGNPNANVADIERLASIAHAAGVPLIVDATFSTPYLCRTIDFGADIVIHSATKYINGNGTAMGGVVVDSGKFEWKGNPRFPQLTQPDPSYHGVVFAETFGAAAFAVRLRTLVLRDVGGSQSPFNTFLMLLGLETLALRMERHSSNALQAAKFLEGHPAVERVNYPGLPSSPYYELAKKYYPKGCAGVFTFEIKGTRETGARFIDSLELIKNVANLADSRTIVVHPATTTHSQLSDEQLRQSGISATTIRLSIGLESCQDILDDLSAALDKAVR